MSKEKTFIKVALKHSRSCKCSFCEEARELFSKNNFSEDTCEILVFILKNMAILIQEDAKTKEIIEMVNEIINRKNEDRNNESTQ